MKIAIVYDLLYPYSIGGAESRNFSLAKHLVMMGHEVHLFGVKMWKGQNTKQVSKNFFMHGVARYKTKYGFKGKRKILEPIKYSLLLYFELLKYRFDVIDVSAFPYFPAFVCKLIALQKRSKLIVTWHEVWDEYWKEYHPVLWPVGRLTERLLAMISRNNISVSKLTSKRLTKIGAKRIHTIENWIDIDENIEASKEKYDIISIGRHLKHKNFDLLLKSIAILVVKYPKIRVLILGEGPETFKLLKMRQALSLDNNVDILSFVKDQKKMYSYLKSSKIFVLLSELEGFSIIAFEAMHFGLPVITLDSKRNALCDYINDKVGYKVGKNEIEVVYRIEEILNDKNQLKNMHGNTKQFAEQYMTNYKKVEKVYL